MGYMTPKYMKEHCINKNKEICKYVITTTEISVNGEKFAVYYCKCEDEICATCSPEFDPEFDGDE